jgi:hypothetical protein
MSGEPKKAETKEEKPAELVIRFLTDPERGRQGIEGQD